MKKNTSNRNNEIKNALVKNAVVVALIGLLILSASGGRAHAEPVTSFDLRDQVESYQHRYGLRDLYTKEVDNLGRGFEPLYGVRNFRVVLNGVYYRGGANNDVNRNFRRPTPNPLQVSALKNLCEEGFTEAVYLYATHFEKAPEKVRCHKRNGQDGELRYEQINGLIGNTEHEQLEKIYDHIIGRVPGPIYDHCWNGWHASGYIAAIALRQFCRFNAVQADRYWMRNTDGVADSNTQKIRAKIHKFRPFRDMPVSPEARSLICPDAN